MSEASADNLFAALDSLSHKIDKQLAKVRDIQTNKKGSIKPAGEESVGDESLEGDDFEEDYEEEYSA